MIAGQKHINRYILSIQNSKNMKKTNKLVNFKYPDWTDIQFNDNLISPRKKLNNHPRLSITFNFLINVNIDSYYIRSNIEFAYQPEVKLCFFAVESFRKKRISRIPIKTLLF